ncbi:hypothetical protein OS31_32210 [Dickeya oryzae]
MVVVVVVVVLDDVFGAALCMRRLCVLGWGGNGALLYALFAHRHYLGGIKSLGAYFNISF